MTRHPGERLFAFKEVNTNVAFHFKRYLVCSSSIVGMFRSLARFICYYRQISQRRQLRQMNSCDTFPIEDGYTMTKWEPVVHR